MVRYYGLALVLLTGCGQIEDNINNNINKTPNSPDVYQVEDPEFDDYVKLFEEEAEERGENRKVTNQIINYADLEYPTAGICYYYSNKTPVILIDRKYWEDASPEEKENLMSHELGHCQLLRDHMLDFADGRPVSIMYPSLIPFYFKEYRDEYLDELYTVYNDWFSLAPDQDHTFICGEKHD